MAKKIKTTSAPKFNYKTKCDINGCKASTRTVTIWSYLNLATNKMEARCREHLMK